MDREEAINIVRKNIPHLGIGATEMTEALESLIPELRESEDERIRKEIISAFKFWFKEGVTIIPEEKGGRITVEQAIAYLEKQKEQKLNIEICPHSIKSKSYKENYYPIEDCDYGLEIAFDILEKTFGEVRGYQTDDGIREHQTAIEAVRKAKEQKPAEWSDKDKRALNDAIVALSMYAIGEIPYILPSQLLEDVERLKSLRPSWKPSEEQIQAITYLASSIPPNFLKEQEYTMRLVDEVISNLKKLCQ